MMMRSRFGFLLRTLFVTALGAGTAHAAPPTKEACIETNNSAQSLRRAGKFAASRAQLAVCADPKCPEIVRNDCIQRLADLDQSQPTIVFDLKNGTDDVSTANISVDGTLLTSKLDGIALRVDPGSHTFTFEVPGQPVVTKTFVIKEGEKGRRERIAIGETKAAPTVATSPAPAPAPESTGGGMSTQKVLGLVVGGVGVAGLAVGSVFGLLTSSSYSSQKDNCASREACANRDAALSDHDSAETNGTISTIGFIGGGALLAGGAILFFTAPKASSSSTGITVAPSLTAREGGFSVSGVF